MPKIKVDHSEFEKTAKEIDVYVKVLKDNMIKSQSEVTSLSSAWQGTDFTQFKKEFSQIDNKDSTHEQMVKALESYASFLRFAGNKYKDAQTNAVNRANRLPKW